VTATATASAATDKSAAMTLPLFSKTAPFVCPEALVDPGFVR
jgi:hypothetical protein